MAYNSRYTGAEIDAAIDMVNGVAGEFDIITDGQNIVELWMNGELEIPHPTGSLYFQYGDALARRVEYGFVGAVHYFIAFGYDMNSGRANDVIILTCKREGNNFVLEDWNEYNPFGSYEGGASTPSTPLDLSKPFTISRGNVSSEYKFTEGGLFRREVTSNVDGVFLPTQEPDSNTAEQIMPYKYMDALVYKKVVHVIGSSDIVLPRAAHLLSVDGAVNIGGKFMIPSRGDLYQDSAYSNIVHVSTPMNGELVLTYAARTGYGYGY